MDLSEPPEVALLGVGRHDSSQDGRYRIMEHWCIHLYEWSGSVTVDGDRQEITPGCIGLIPPAAELVYDYADGSVHHFAHFRALGRRAPRNIRAMTYSFPRQVELRKKFAQATLLQISEPHHARSVLWEILWDLATTVTESDETSEEPRVRLACEILNAHLQNAPRIDDLAYQVGLSHNQLTRLFRAHVGQTPLKYLIARRVARAKHLLRYSDLPVKEIGELIGIEDPAAFNKTFKKEAGVAPRTFRMQLRHGQLEPSTI